MNACICIGVFKAMELDKIFSGFWKLLRLCSDFAHWHLLACKRSL